MVTDNPPIPTCEYHGKKTIYTPAPSFKLQPNLPPEPQTPRQPPSVALFPPSVSPGYAPRERGRPAAVLDRRAVAVTDESGDTFCPLVVPQQQLVFHILVLD